MDLANKLHLLLEVSKAGSFAKAADGMNIDRSVLSKHIKQLEEHLGVRLLNRTTRSLSLTQVGQQIVEKADQISQLLDDTQQIAENFQTEPSGKVRISSSTLFGKLYLQPSIEKFLHKYPKASVELMLDDLHVDVIRSSFDIAFRIGPMRDSSMVARKLAKNTTAIIASRNLIEKHGNPETPDELVKLPFIIYSNGNFIVDKLKFYDKAKSDGLDTYPISGSYMVNEAELIIESVKSGLGAALIGQFMLPNNLESSNLVQLLPEYETQDFGDIYAMYSHRQQSPLVRAFIDIIQEEIGIPPIWEKHFNKS
ncbi:LysR family transcriptional regulator [Vibrio sp. 1863]|uniref:LysR family transcriptional regulator n=1 Tax=Vibrio sp. 1863 TaxID=3074579 RepID=UPI0029645DB2|nr:LysR family transcriptional regulator [Vibrio sp. 1863]MDW2077847.1 LysR family transcriptional regulator [Vibrio sp. 1863]